MDAATRPDRRFVGAAAALTSAVGDALNPLFLAPEEETLRRLCDHARLPPAQSLAVQHQALQLVQGVRAARSRGGGLDALLRQYHLASPEGVVLMCLAEALLRIPDAHTADRLIADKLSEGDWERHLGDSDSLLVNASTWGLMLTGRLVELDRGEIGTPRGWFGRLATRLSEPVARAALRQAMRVLGHQFVMGRTIGEALQRTNGGSESRYAYSFDMLGEAAITAADAQRYFDKYRDAISEIGLHASAREPAAARPGISVKLSALHPRYEYLQRERVVRELAPKLLGLVGQARAAGIALTVDAEEAERLELSLQLIDIVLASAVTDGYGGFGLAVQAYQKRAFAVLQWLIQQTRERRRQITVRLVKGAYWDTEIKRAQERGLAGFPVFTRKINTDTSYLACARLLAGHVDLIYPQFATHNAQTVAYVSQVMSAVGPGRFEFQRLHGMGEELYEQIIGGDGAQSNPRPTCRVYAPVGPHEDLLPYLVRRLLENGANTSFVNRILDERLPPEQIIMDPIAEADRTHPAAEPRIALPERLFGSQRRNSRGVNFADGAEVRGLLAQCAAASAMPPLDPASSQDIERAMSVASKAQRPWGRTSVAERAAILEAAAELFETDRAALIARCVLEAGRTLPDSAAEVREAIDFLRYYAVQARGLEAPLLLAGPTGERNTLRVRGRGVFACISPWNFPLSIFTGQVSAALVTGNAVLAKPAEQTPLTASLAVQLLHRAGVPTEVLQLLPGGPAVGEALTADSRVCGVVFTGSTTTARLIARKLAGRSGAIATLIAETGGINAMIVDSSALPEQVVLDSMASAFNSAGQRCSALRVLLLQEEIAPRVLTLLAGQMDELAIGPAWQLTTDVGPVIDDEALAGLNDYATRVVVGARWHHRARIPAAIGAGRYFAPLAVEVGSLAAVDREVFGPVLHIVRYRAEELDALIEAINGMGYGLTLGIHTRIDSSAQAIADRVQVGNVYVNRNMIGAVVGVQPFGGCGLSGTGPKAGGPHYLSRFVTEQTLTINTAALGGNATLLSM
ncbi:MAG TPA: L-glutamate gamma-semialdehyde dehydrogenase [Steroidobacteraceae bacterium]|nr:L-glutamate gamma-semialdehyde dehydrogenase [Steroidobacteraceae bacterium]